MSGAGDYIAKPEKTYRGVLRQLNIFDSMFEFAPC